MRRPAILAAVLLAGLAAPAGAAVKKVTFQVPVTVPDDTGAKVLIDTDVYLPDGFKPSDRRPFIEVFHGGGSDKANTFDAGHAKFFAQHGYVSLIYSQRGHGASGGLTSVAGPPEMRDLFDVTHWALGHKFAIDPTRIGLTGYSQGGLSTNLAQVWASDKLLNPYGIRFRVLEPGNTPEYIADALVPGGVTKLSVGVGLVETYAVGAHAHMSPLLGKWIGTTSADQLFATGASKCETEPHDTMTSSTLADLAVRSVGCFVGRMNLPVHWAQAFDDNVFESSMAVNMWRRMPRHAVNRLYLSMGGHAAPSAPDAVEADKLRDQLAYFDFVLRGAPLRLPVVTYWTRDPKVQVPADAFKYPNRAWERHTAPSWPPPGMTSTPFALSGDGLLASPKSATTASLPLAGAQADPGSDGVLQAAFSATPLGATPLAPGTAGTNSPGAVAGFTGPVSDHDHDLSGRTTARLRWTPNVPDTQVVLKLWDRAPDGTLTLFARSVRGLRNATPGSDHTLTLSTNDYSLELDKGHSVLATVTAGDASFYKAYAGSSAGGTLTAGAVSTLTLPLRHQQRNG